MTPLDTALPPPIDAFTVYVPILVPSVMSVDALPELLVVTLVELRPCPLDPGGYPGIEKFTPILGIGFPYWSIALTARDVGSVAATTPVWAEPLISDKNSWLPGFTTNCTELPLRVPSDALRVSGVAVFVIYTVPVHTPFVKLVVVVGDSVPVASARKIELLKVVSTCALELQIYIVTVNGVPALIVVLVNEGSKTIVFASPWHWVDCAYIVDMSIQPDKKGDTSAKSMMARIKLFTVLRFKSFLGSFIT